MPFTWLSSNPFLMQLHNAFSKPTVCSITYMIRWPLPSMEHRDLYELIIAYLCSFILGHILFCGALLLLHSNSFLNIRWCHTLSLPWTREVRNMPIQFFTWLFLSASLNIHPRYHFCWETFHNDRQKLWSLSFVPLVPSLNWVKLIEASALPWVYI